MLGATSGELADPELVSDDTLRLILCAAATARYGPDAMRIGRSGKDADPEKMNAESLDQFDFVPGVQPP